MRKQRDDGILVKDDSDLFRLVRQLTEEQPPAEAGDLERETEPVIQIEPSFHEARKTRETVRQANEADPCQMD